MERLLRWVTPRNLLLALAAGLLIRFFPELSAPLRLRYNAWRYPPQAQEKGADAGILGDLERRDALRYAARHRRLKAKLAAARAQGFDTRAVEAKADALLVLNTAEHRRVGLKKLAELEMFVPREKVQYIPMSGPPEEVVPPDARGRKAKNQPKRRRRKR